jgi:hypothetical protein
MSPDLKAKKLVYEFYNISDKITFKESKKCGLHAVDLIIAKSSKTAFRYTEFNEKTNELIEYTEEFYWQKVKQEIEKL